MTQLLISNLDPVVVTMLTQQATTHGRSLEDEAKAILEKAAADRAAAAWAEVDEIRERLAATGRQFSDSVELLREDRER